MYISRLRFNVKPKETQYFIDEVQELAKIAQSMPGCVTFQLLRAVDNDNELTLYEEWGDRAQADAFKKLPSGRVPSSCSCLRLLATQ